jgi:hypothetical protein
MTDTSVTASPSDPPAVLAFYKNFFTSKTVIANALGLLVPFGTAFGVRWMQLTPEQVTAATEMIFGVFAFVMPLANWVLRYFTAHPVSFSASRWTAPPPQAITAAQVQPGARVFVGAAAAQEIKSADAEATAASAPKPDPAAAPAAPKPASKTRQSRAKGK